MKKRSLSLGGRIFVITAVLLVVFVGLWLLYYFCNSDTAWNRAEYGSVSELSEAIGVQLGDLTLSSEITDRRYSVISENTAVMGYSYINKYTGAQSCTIYITRDKSELPVYEYDDSYEVWTRYSEELEKELTLYMKNEVFYAALWKNNGLFCFLDDTNGYYEIKGFQSIIEHAAKDTGLNGKK